MEQPSTNGVILELPSTNGEITDRVMAEVVDLLPTPAALVDMHPAPLDGSGWKIIDGVSKKEQRAKEAQVLPSDEQQVPTAEDPHYDFDNIGNILQGNDFLRI